MVQFFADGTKMGADQNLGQITRKPLNRMFLGRRDSDYCQCVIDAVEIYQRSLSEVEANQVYQRVWGSS